MRSNVIHLPGCNTLNTDVRALMNRLRLRLSQMALELLKEMRDRRIVPNLIVYNATIGACCRANHLPDALEVFTSMQAAQVRPR